MKDFIIHVYDDASDTAIANDSKRWGAYLSGLRASGNFDGDSSIGSGLRKCKGYADAPAATKLDGFIRVLATDINAARQYLTGNPVYEGGGTVEIRELPVDG